MLHSMNRSRGFVCLGVFTLLLSGAIFRVHMRVQTTLIGYELGELKTEEVELMRQRSQLQMQLAKLTSHDHLRLMAAETSPSRSESVVAAR